MRRTNSIELFSLSFLDLLFCGMAGMCLLLLLRDNKVERDSRSLQITYLDIAQSGESHCRKVEVFQEGITPANDPYVHPIGSTDNTGDLKAELSLKYLDENVNKGYEVASIPDSRAYSLRMSFTKNSGSGKVIFYFKQCILLTHPIEYTITRYKTGKKYSGTYYADAGGPDLNRRGRTVNGSLKLVFDWNRDRVWLSQSQIVEPAELDRP